MEVTLDPITISKYGLSADVDQLPALAKMLGVVRDVEEAITDDYVDRAKSFLSALITLNDHTPSWGFAVIPAIRLIRDYWAEQA